MRERDYIFDFCHYVHEHGYNWLRVGTQTDGWADFGHDKAEYLRVGPEFGTKAWKENLETLLDVTARVPDTWVQLIPTFTHKQRQKGGYKRFIEMCRKVNEIVVAGDYKHVFYSAMNEPEHPLSNWMKDEEVRKILLWLREFTPYPVGTDHPGKRSVPASEWWGRFPWVWRDVCDYYAFHPPRNPSPPTDRWRYTVDKYAKEGKFVLWDETTCYASQVEIDKYKLKGKGTIVNMGRGGDRQRQSAMVQEMNKARASGRRGRWLYHSIWGMECLDLGWLPRYST
ncbi:MAG: hypothetical protein ACYTFQ_31405 [Planctomycetota bacterium]|jgi:hypothetical protein